MGKVCMGAIDVDAIDVDRRIGSLAWYLVLPSRYIYLLPQPVSFYP
jgi:hypothetical protein